MKAINGEVIDWTKLIKSGLDATVANVQNAQNNINSIKSGGGIAGGAPMHGGSSERTAGGSSGGGGVATRGAGAGKMSLEPTKGWGKGGGDSGVVKAGSTQENALAKALDFVRSIDGAGYEMGGFSASAIDCSGLIAAAANVASGRDPWSGRFSTDSFNGKKPSGWLSGGGGAFSIGVAYAGEIPGHASGHMAGTINGVNIESQGGTGVEIGGSARGANDKMFKHHYHLSYDNKKGYGYAKGGVFSGRSGQLIEIAEGGVPEVALPLNNAGVEAMAAAMSKYASRDSLRALAPGRAAEVIIYSGETTYDQRNDFSDARITVQAQDPDEMARKLAARQRRSNLTASRPRK